MARIKWIDPWSLGKLSGIMYAGIGLAFGAIISVLSVTGIMQDDKTLVSRTAVIIFPIFYGVIGFLMAAMSAALFNVAVRWVGGLKVEIETDDGA